MNKKSLITKWISECEEKRKAECKTKTCEECKYRDICVVLMILDTRLQIKELWRL